MARKSIGQRTGGRKGTEKSAAADTSDKALANLLERLKTAANTDEIRQLSDQIERVVFHKQSATQASKSATSRGSTRP
jgi:hypothetical protein